MKKKLVMILSFALCAIMLCVLPMLAMAADNIAYVKGGWLRLRAGAANDATTLGSYPVGTPVTVKGTWGDWSFVITPDGQQGYMSSAYLSYSAPATATPKPTITPTPRPTVVPTPEVIRLYVSNKGRAVNMRTGPDTRYPSMAMVDSGTSVIYVSTMGNWTEVQYGNKTGYIFSSYLESADGNIYYPVYYTATPKPTVNPYPAYSMYQTNYTAYVTSENLGNVNLRTAPSKFDAVIGSYSVGTSLKVLGYSSTWCYVQIGIQKGYMMTEFITTEYPGYYPTKPTTPYVAYVTSDNYGNVNLRTGPDKSYSAIASYPIGTQLTVYNRGSVWSYVCIGETYGYMMTQYITGYEPAPYNNYITGVAISNYSPRVNQTLTAMVSPASATCKFVWTNDLGETLSTSSAYTVDASQMGRAIRVRVTGTGSFSGNATSSWTSAVTTGGSSVVALSGVSISPTTASADDVLTAKLSPANATAAINWYRDDGVLLGSGPSYKLTHADEGHNVYCTAIGNGMTTGSATSNKAVIKESLIQKAYLVTGVKLNNYKPTVGTTLYASIEPSAATVDYYWQRDDSAGTIVSTSNYYVVKEADAGYKIYLTVEGKGNTSGAATTYATVAGGSKKIEPVFVEKVPAVETPSLVEPVKVEKVPAVEAVPVKKEPASVEPVVVEKITPEKVEAPLIEAITP